LFGWVQGGNSRWLFLLLAAINEDILSYLVALCDLFFVGQISTSAGFAGLLVQGTAIE
jgi:hypothetical protein